MSSTSSPSFSPPRPHRLSAPAPALGLACRVAVEGFEREGHFAVRRQVFCDEQHLFDCDDRDARDDRPESLHVIGTVAGRIEGAVRLYPLEGSGRWKGDRLAVLPGSRVRHLGALLVGFAVRTAGDLGGERMVAHIQLGNVAFFAALGWVAEGAPLSFHGADHQLMAIGLRRSGR